MDICTLSLVLGGFALYGTEASVLGKFTRNIIPMSAMVTSSKRERRLRQR